VACESDDICLLSQIVDLPASTMSGVTLDLRARVRRQTAQGWVGVQLAAINPEAPVDPVVGFSHVGFLQLVPESDGWEHLEDSVTLAGPAQLIAVVLFVIGDGAVASFDDVSVAADMGFADCGPMPNGVAPLAGGLPPFPVGFTNENPRNGSDQGLADLTARAAETMDMVNLFVHIRWNGLAGKSMLSGHESVVDAARHLDRLGLARMITLDFTHDSVDGIGDLNPLPDGTPKRSYALLHRTRRHHGSPILAEPGLECVPPARRASGRRGLR
jgi:hypothetical protein